MDSFPLEYTQERRCNFPSTKVLLPLPPQGFKPIGDNVSHLSRCALPVVFALHSLKHEGKQGALMNSFVYDDNPFSSPPIDLPSKLIKRATLALFTTPQSKCNVWTNRACLLFKIQMRTAIISFPGAGRPLRWVLCPRLSITARGPKDSVSPCCTNIHGAESWVEKN